VSPVVVVAVEMRRIRKRSGKTIAALSPGCTHLSVCGQCCHISTQDLGICICICNCARICICELSLRGPWIVFWQKDFCSSDVNIVRADPRSRWPLLHLFPAHKKSGFLRLRHVLCGKGIGIEIGFGPKGHCCGR